MCDSGVSCPTSKASALFTKSELTVVLALHGPRRARRRPHAGRCCWRRSLEASGGLAGRPSFLAGGCCSVAVRLLCGLAAATARPCWRRILTAGIGRTRRRVRAGAERTRGVLAAVAVPPAAALTVKLKSWAPARGFSRVVCLFVSDQTSCVTPHAALYTRACAVLGAAEVSKSPPPPPSD